jgi:hypothetical protein
MAYSKRACEQCATIHFGTAGSNSSYGGIERTSIELGDDTSYTPIVDVQHPSFSIIDEHGSRERPSETLKWVQSDAANVVAQWQLQFATKYEAHAKQP